MKCTSLLALFLVHLVHMWTGTFVLDLFGVISTYAFKNCFVLERGQMPLSEFTRRKKQVNVSFFFNDVLRLIDINTPSSCLFLFIFSICVFWGFSSNYKSKKYSKINSFSLDLTTDCTHVVYETRFESVFRCLKLIIYK